MNLLNLVSSDQPPPFHVPKLHHWLEGETCDVAFSST